jgi:aldehyde:ferredoxin oxidoreductase
LTREHDTLPARLMEDALPTGPAQGMVIDKDTLEMLKDAYYGLRGWDLKTGIPTVETLKALGLADLAADI